MGAKGAWEGPYASSGFATDDRGSSTAAAKGRRIGNMCTRRMSEWISLRARAHESPRPTTRLRVRHMGYAMPAAVTLCAV
jgi:hypothetical protein